MFNLADIVRNLMPCPLVIEKDLCKKFEKSTVTKTLHDSFNSSPAFK